MEPASHFFYSHRLKLQFWDFGSEGNPPLILVHGSRDHARNWDWVARDLRENYHVYAIDLRGHGNSAWAPGALYAFSEHVLDLSVFADIVSKGPISIIGHSLGAVVSLLYAGSFPNRVHKLVAIEGTGVGPVVDAPEPIGQRLRRWIEKVRDVDHHPARAYPDLNAAIARMQTANPFLSADVARHLTLHGTNWNADGSLVWKFDNYTRVLYPFGLTPENMSGFLSAIECPTLLFWGQQSFARDPEFDPQAQAIRNQKIVKVDQAGHWLHHDQLGIFLAETNHFLR